jgi:conjugal transfer pilus assembly protein TraB
MHVIDEKLHGYVVSDFDGKVGIGGQLVTRHGQYIARAGLWGVLSGIGQGLAPSNIGVNVAGSGESSTYFPNMSEVLRAGVATGMSKSFDKVADFYLDLAEEALPTISVDAGRVVDIVILRGAQLTLSD